MISRDRRKNSLKESNAMRELHEIREKNSELYKHMSDEEKINYINSEAEKFLEDLKKFKENNSKKVS